eukprot:SAG31_NODE_10376_length_1146_cov_1.295129_2_plen_56_part_00
MLTYASQDMLAAPGAYRYHTKVWDLLVGTAPCGRNKFSCQRALYCFFLKNIDTLN